MCSWHGEPPLLFLPKYRPRKRVNSIQLISGHESKKSLEVYQHLALNTVEHAYQEAVRSIAI
jgi:hypothetical protein